jgi:hypothetical protein
MVFQHQVIFSLSSPVVSYLTSLEEEPELPGLPELDDPVEARVEENNNLKQSANESNQFQPEPVPEGKSWERAWTFSELRYHQTHFVLRLTFVRTWNKWTLASDSGLLNTLSQLSENISRTSKDISARYDIYIFTSWISYLHLVLKIFLI